LALARVYIFPSAIGTTDLQSRYFSACLKPDNPFIQVPSAQRPTALGDVIGTLNQTAISTLFASAIGTTDLQSRYFSACLKPDNPFIQVPSAQRPTALGDVIGTLNQTAISTFSQVPSARPIYAAGTSVPAKAEFDPFASAIGTTD
jgi:hypothetical protein